MHICNFHLSHVIHYQNAEITDSMFEILLILQPTLMVAVTVVETCR